MLCLKNSWQRENQFIKHSNKTPVGKVWHSFGVDVTRSGSNFLTLQQHLTESSSKTVPDGFGREPSAAGALACDCVVCEKDASKRGYNPQGKRIFFCVHSILLLQNQINFVSTFKYIKRLNANLEHVEQDLRHVLQHMCRPPSHSRSRLSQVLFCSKLRKMDICKFARVSGDS